MQIYFDGGCTPKGVMSACVLVVHDTMADVYVGRTGRGNSYDAEWAALFHAVSVARTLAHPVCLIGDNLSVIEGAGGLVVPRKGRTLGFVQMFAEASRDIEIQACRWVRRDLNLAGRYLQGGNDSWFQAGLQLLEGLYEFRLLPLPTAP